MVAEIVIWHGDTAEVLALLAAIEHNCPFPPPCNGAARCAAHRSLFDQRLLDGLLFARWMRERLLAEEGCRV